MNSQLDFKIEILKEKQIPYVIKMTSVRKFRLSFNQKGMLVISYPLGIKSSSLVKFVEKNIDWILVKYKDISDKQISYENDSIQYFMGKPYRLRINISKTKRVDVLDSIMFVSINQYNQVRDLILKWRYEHAEIIFQEILYSCFRTMQHELATFPRLVIKLSKSKWGCCYFNENKIMLNVALTQVSSSLIEYVIFHELTHFLIHNHSKAFHMKLEKYLPNAKILRKELKKYNTIL